jgi:ABC-type Mn2+/Zn2+ transport system permease subunit
VALLVLPGLSALRLNLSFKKTLLAAIGFSLISTILGVMLSAVVGISTGVDITTGGLIVFISAILFLFTILYSKI